MKKWGFLVSALLLLLACEKTVQLQPDVQAPKLVVEAQIETGQAPYVVLSNSLNYFSTIDAATLNNTYVTGARITVNDGNRTVLLKEYTVPLTGGYTFYYYSIDPANAMFGEQGKTYRLTIETGGQVYQSQTQIPVLAKKIDSLWWKKAPFNTDTNKVVLMSRVTDPPGYGNYIRYFTKTNRGEFYPGINSVFDDQIIDGKTYDIQIDQGVTKNEKVKFEDYGYFKRGDTVIVKMCNIDKASFDFWKTWEFAWQSVGNPFSTPGKVTGNIDNQALGSFCGYAVQYKSLIIPK
ncbi:MAG: DUF4249 domain-containing protein [Chitinophagaceae bacterium]|nr:DUF4249 domain-containing protein [Bacteroidota bacterium]TAJ62312.1 MAG: DUF4249 domain-containing protein [Chitinophagaceae bacterium]